MADSSSYRTSRGGPLPPRRDGPSSDPARHAVSDPLAELARLIGQDEAFGAIVRNSARAEPQREPDPLPPPWRNRSEPASRQTYEEPAPHESNSYAYGESASAPAVYDPHPCDPHQYDDGHVAADAHPQQAVAQAAGHYEHDASGEYYEEGREEEGHYEGEEDYADHVPRRRRGVLVMAAAVVGRRGGDAFTLATVRAGLANAPSAP